MIGIDATDADPLFSAKTGLGIEDVLEASGHVSIPPPEGDVESPLAGTDHRLLVRQLPGRGITGAASLQGTLHKKDDKIIIKSTGQGASGMRTRWVSSRPNARRHGYAPNAGEVGFVVAGIKDIHGAPVGDTLVPARTGSEDIPIACRVSRRSQPQVYAGLFPGQL